jgi:parvulin-like peptidyl-prolyl isomerase
VKRKLLIPLLLAGACVAGIACGRLVYRLPAVRTAIGIWCGRGRLLAIAQGVGIYEVDLRRALAEVRYATGVDEKDRHEDNIDKRQVLTRLISNSVARSLGAPEEVSRAKIASELNLLRWQFRDEKTWRVALGASGLSVRSLRRSIVGDLHAQQWIDRQIASQINVTGGECRSFYEMHPESFLQSVRFRASHLFLASPPETPPELVETKQQAIKSFATRIKNGEKLAELAAVASEDGATKSRGGDLGFFSESRMPADFFAAVSEMHVGETSQPIRTRLGLHIIQLTDSRPARPMTFDEARKEIALTSENEKRRTALQNLTADLLGRAEFVSNRL